MPFYGQVPSPTRPPGHRRPAFHHILLPFLEFHIQRGRKFRRQMAKQVQIYDFFSDLRLLLLISGVHSLLLLSSSPWEGGSKFVDSFSSPLSLRACPLSCSQGSASTHPSLPEVLLATPSPSYTAACPALTHCHLLAFPP